MEARDLGCGTVLEIDGSDGPDVTVQPTRVDGAQFILERKTRLPARVAMFYFDTQKTKMNQNQGGWM